jgi:metallo-beta-lactamase family protein
MNQAAYPFITHRGAVTGVTGSCHQLHIDAENSVLIDCGLFQGVETSPGGSDAGRLQIDFPVDTVRALLVTHCHIDHVGRIPHLFAAGFNGPIYCSEPTAQLLPLVLEDAVEIGFTRDDDLVRKFLHLLHRKIVAVPYGQWQTLPLNAPAQLQIRLQPAGHILGSAYIECAAGGQRIVFSGDLGGPNTPLLPAPKAPYGADVLVLESTYGNRLHEGRKNRKAQLRELIVRCLQNRGCILIPAFSIGRTQELLYELEDIIYRHKRQTVAAGLAWDDLEIIVDSPLANRFTEVYKRLRPFWDEEAKLLAESGRHPLSFEQLTTINSHQDHLRAVERIRQTAYPCIVLAASGMCAGGRIVNYLRALIEDPRSDILFVGYQAQGTPGRDIQDYGAQHGYVLLGGRRYTINAGVHSLSGYSAHADQASLLRFVRRMRNKPKEIRLVHGDAEAKETLRQMLQQLLPETRVWIPEA